MKKLMMVVTLLLCITIMFATLSGCGKKADVQEQAEQQVEEVQEEAAVDTAAVEEPAPAEEVTQE